MSNLNWDFLGANENVTNVQKHFFLNFIQHFQKALFGIDLKITKVFFPAADTSTNDFLHKFCHME